MKQLNKKPVNDNFKYLRMLIYVYILLMIGLTIYTWQIIKSNDASSNVNQLQRISHDTADTLSSLVKTKYFRIIRLNLNTECPIFLMNKLCKSNSCTVCRCDQKDIPSLWRKTDRVVSFSNKKGGLDVWSKQRTKTQIQIDDQKLKAQLLKIDQKWVWHVQDQENDKGQYFDIDTNVQSYTSYNGSYIWQLIYEENCFRGRESLDDMCIQEKTLYKVISGLHTSISTHLSNLYRNITTNTIEWGDTGDQKYFFNRKQYQRRVLNHPERVENLLFLYQILVHAIRKIQPYLKNSNFIVSDNISEDFTATQLLHNFLKGIKGQRWTDFNKNQQSEIQRFFDSQNPKVRQYQKYIHNISRILNCVQCQKCRLFGKMQTYGVGTALKILLGYQQPYKRNQMVALFNLLNKISTSVAIYFKYRPIISHNQWFIVKLFGGLGAFLISFVWIVLKMNLRGRIKKSFKHVFPPQSKNL